MIIHSKPLLVIIVAIGTSHLSPCHAALSRDAVITLSCFTFLSEALSRLHRTRYHRCSLAVPLSWLPLWPPSLPVILSVCTTITASSVARQRHSSPISSGAHDYFLTIVSLIMLHYSLSLHCSATVSQDHLSRQFPINCHSRIMFSIHRLLLLSFSTVVQPIA